MCCPLPYGQARKIMETIRMTNRIEALFLRKKENILSVFFTAGFPQLNDTVRIAHELEQAGADMIEIGIPFSDPVADGPAIQHSNKVALDNGMNLVTLFNQVAAIRKTVSIPVLLMGYLNPVMQFGMERFVEACNNSGVDGIILPDLPPEEYTTNYKALFANHAVSVSFLITPTSSPDRIRMLDELSTGFIYAVSASSTTGTKESFSQDQLEYFQRLKGMHLNNPFLIGFGISNSATFGQACRYAAGAIVGSAFIKSLEVKGNCVSEFINGLRREIKSPDG